MARLPRLVVPQLPHYIFQSGIDRQAAFRDAEDYAAFLAWLREAAKQFKVAIHAYALMPTQLHLLATPSEALGLSRMMQWVGRHYVPYFNAKYQRAGTLWQGRFKATVIESEQYFLLCSRYIELHPVRDGLATTPGDYPWSSFVHHVGRRPDPLITDHRLYWALGNTPFEREASYQSLMDQGLSAAEEAALQGAALKGWPLGSERFKALLAKQIKRPVSPGKRGRPAKTKALVVPLSPSKLPE